MVKEATSLSFILVNSEFEALLLESSLIKKYQPKYNVTSKDDKHPLYIKITKEVYPRVLTVRKTEINDQNLGIYGPFPSAKTVRKVLSYLRRILPFSDHKLGKKPCLYSQIGLCSPCPNAIEKEPNLNKKEELRKKYLKNIRYLKNVLERKLLKVKKDLEKEMQEKARGENYEEAGVTRDQIKMLDYITSLKTDISSFLENPNLLEDLRKKELKGLKRILDNFYQIKRLKRIECYDVAHTAGVFPTASMVTFIDGEPQKEFYRHFRVRNKKVADDVAAMEEIIKRRAKNFKAWGKPDLIIVDGGKPQVGAFWRSIEKYHLPIIGLAKREETLVFPILQEKTLTFKEERVKDVEALRLLQRIRDEAHRFARRYHHLLIKKSLLS